MTDAGGHPPLIPPVDATANNEFRRESEIEGKLLAISARMRESELSDRSQSRWVRWAILACGISAVIFMGYVLAHSTHQMALGRSQIQNPSAQVALIVAPIIAITTIAVFLIIGAFRSFRERDFENAPVSTMANKALERF